MVSTRFALVTLLSINFGVGAMAQTYVGHYSYPFRGAQLYSSPPNHVLLYVESDGRHLAAISRSGKLLWHRDPFTEAKLPFYRIKDPQVNAISQVKRSDVPRGKDPSHFVWVFLTNSQFGLIRISDGEFILEGQD